MIVPSFYLSILLNFLKYFTYISKTTTNLKTYALEELSEDFYNFDKQNRTTPSFQLYLILEFYPCNDDKEEFALSLSDIEMVKANLYSITVYGKGKKHRFHVYKAFLWKKIICSSLEA